MADRRSLWSHRKLLKLARKFVPATDEVWRLQREADPDCRLFRQLVRGHDRPSQTTMQGFYVFSPGLVCLGSANSRRPERMARMLEEALQRWEGLPESQRHLPKGTDLTTRHRWEDSYPEDGLILRGTVRDLPRDGDPKRRPRQPFNRHPAWFSKKEARQWLPADPVMGAKHQLPRKPLERMACLHLVDTVRGQSERFPTDELGDTRIETEVVDREGEVVRLRITGHTEAKAEGRTMRTRMRGVARYDLKKQRFLEFELVVLGLRTGGTRYNGRGRNPGPSRVGFLFRLAPEGWRVPPAFINWYGVDWVRSPER